MLSSVEQERLLVPYPVSGLQRSSSVTRRRFQCEYYVHKRKESSASWAGRSQHHSLQTHGSGLQKRNHYPGSTPLSARELPKHRECPPQRKRNGKRRTPCRAPSTHRVAGSLHNKLAVGSSGLSEQTDPCRGCRKEVRLSPCSMPQSPRSTRSGEGGDEEAWAK